MGISKVEVKVEDKGYLQSVGLKQKKLRTRRSLLQYNSIFIDRPPRDSSFLFRSYHRTDQS